ncbi:hypothetical protein CFC21_068132 [Triticum aestivum]|uniref:Jacalin-type lectin domain-containing protein n=2 Tax=Triticum aestivum TaxID=4565 RepID=A0A9R1KPB8_WHEAT|nr:hypothetical protein CFC21_068132 [Triticum aestivum]
MDSPRSTRLALVGSEKYTRQEIAVKKLHYMPGLNDEQFKHEFNNLMRVQHQNIIRLVGYCYEIRHIHHELKGEYVFARVEERALCFEYLRGGSLDRHLSDEFSGLDWHTRYKIIKGICEGLNYLHKGSNDPMYHLDLKPANILLDEEMMPKIGDFGLSRLFASTKTFTTKILAGTLAYMPPEYIQKRQISEKYDIFSLGVIIIEIIAGPLGRFKYADMSSSEEFIQHVNKNWRKRIAEVDCRQVKRCIKIAVNCVDADKGNRPTIEDVIHELKEGEEQDKSQEPVVTRLGPWGGNGGMAYDITVTPHRLKSVTIYSGIIVDQLKFSYTDHSGHQRNVGQWGGSMSGDGYTIKLQPSEFLTEMAGTIGTFFRTHSNNVITSLALVTNQDRYGPFGRGGGSRFRVPMERNSNIVGFFARAGSHLDAIGVYVSRISHTTDHDGEEVVSCPGEEQEESQEPVATKLGPWGGNGGTAYDITVAPHRLESVTVYSGVIVDVLEFSYTDHSGHEHNVGPWGGPWEGNAGHKIKLRPSEFVTEISGTVGRFGRSYSNVITSLTMVTNEGTYGPFGEGRGSPFRNRVERNSKMVGFFARAGRYLHAIGVYVKPVHHTPDHGGEEAIS